jgi:hypothetical protein
MKPAALLVLVLLLHAAVATACGDKFLVRCVANRTPSPQDARAHIAIVADGADSVARLLELGIEKDLTKRGYRVYLVHSDDELAELLSEVPVDLAIVDGWRIERIAATLPSRVVILPAIDARAGHSLPVLDKKYAYTLKVPGEQSTAMLSVEYAIEDAR